VRPPRPPRLHASTVPLDPSFYARARRPCGLAAVRLRIRSRAAVKLGTSVRGRSPRACLARRERWACARSSFGLAIASSSSVYIGSPSLGVVVSTTNLMPRKRHPRR
jgi:hypothetical protein